MPIAFHIDKTTQAVFVTGTGDIHVEDIMTTEEEILDHPEFKKGMCSYIDFSQARPEPNFDFEKIKLSARFIESVQSERGKCKFSIYAPGINTHLMAKIFERLTEHLEIETKVFNSEYEAKEWLAEALSQS